MNAVLDIVALRSLASIADSGGFRRAAESLHLSQSAVSQHIRRLEQACGSELFDRTARTVRFTSAGALLVADARKILAAHDDALDRLRGHRTRDATIVVGSTEHAADLLLPAITTRLHQAYPDHALRFRIDRGVALNERINGGSVDAAVLLGPGQGPHIHSAGQLPLAWYGAPTSVSGTDPLPLVAIDGPCTIRRRAQEALSSNGIAHTLVCEAGHLAGVLQAVRAGVGVALLADCGPAVRELPPRPDLPPVTAEPLHVRHGRDVPPELARHISDSVTTVLTGR